MAKNSKPASKKSAAKKSKGQTKDQRIANLEKARAARGTSPFAKMSIAQLQAAKEKSTDPREQSILRRYLRSALRAAGKPIPSEAKAAAKPAKKSAAKGKAAAQKSAKPAKGKGSTKPAKPAQDADEEEDF